ELIQKNGVSEAVVDESLAIRSQAAAELDSAIAQLEQAKRDLERTKIRAPFDGRVRQKAVGLGQSVGLATALGVVFAIDFAEVRLPIAGRELQFLDLPEMADDAPVEVELRDAINEASETVWKATIIRTEGALDKDTLELFAIARVDDPFGLKSEHPPLRIGQPVVGRRDGHQDLVVEDAQCAPTLALEHADDSKPPPVDPHLLAHGVPKAEQGLRHARSQNGYLGAISHVRP
ncbi:MAG: HlyD family efflux transporter periplasmic adaptor subunit, partial [Myxococcales bacterium]|nr:HlyD family efflux transporter periplasmic adaptor subunit [Myxococcales bacterium]